MTAGASPTSDTSVIECMGKCAPAYNNAAGVVDPHVLAYSPAGIDDITPVTAYALECVHTIASTSASTYASTYNNDNMGTDTPNDWWKGMVDSGNWSSMRSSWVMADGVRLGRIYEGLSR